MKVWGLVYAALALGSCLVVNADQAAASSHHHKHHEPHHEPRLRFSVEGTKAELDAALRSPHAHVDIRSIRAVQDASLPITASSKVRADVVGTTKAVEKFAKAGAVHSSVAIHAGKHIRGHISTTSTPLKVLQREAYNEDTAIANDRADVAACRERTQGFLDDLQAGSSAEDAVLYTNNAFFDCYRPADEVFAFLDELARQNPEFVTTFANASRTFEGRAIPAFKLSTSSLDEDETTDTKRTLYTQALIHAREWQAGAATFFTMAAILDDLRAEKPAATSIFEEFDWYFVPIVNIDGYQYSWDVDRMWRTNRHLENERGEYVPGVDLNRNWPPEEFFNLNPDDVDEETNPGDYPLSEPSTAGLFDFITSLEALSGVVDMHTFGGQVLRPFSNQKGGGAEPFGSKMQALGEAVRGALSTKPEVQYVSETGAYLYEAFGCFDDGMFLQYNLTVPALTIEVEGDDFISPQSSIRPVGANIYGGLRQFAHEALVYSDFVEALGGETDSDSDE
ncbi:hypothetical protein BBJ28_00005542 [Nothophytophthora sp. Chile5]|nr:hypothetical protein BBJ28_00005542 [Nothophytophthora sp. Chile5]